MKRIYWLLLVSVPGLLFFSVWQVYQYQVLVKEVAVLEERQQDQFEVNKRLVADLAQLRSPARIEALVEEDDSVKRRDNSNRVRIRVAEEAGDE